MKSTSELLRKPKGQYDEKGDRVLPEWGDRYVGVDASKYADMLIQEAFKAVPLAIQNNRPVQEGFMAYNILVDNFEILCVANVWLNQADLEEYREEIKKFMEEKNLNSDSLKDPVVGAKLAKFKLRLLLTRIFGKKAVTGNLEV